MYLFTLNLGLPVHLVIDVSFLPIIASLVLGFLKVTHQRRPELIYGSLYPKIREGRSSLEAQGGCHHDFDRQNTVKVCAWSVAYGIIRYIVWELMGVLDWSKY